MNPLSLRETRDTAAWDARLPASPQATVFSSTGFLQASGLPWRLFEVQDGARTVALLPVTEDETGLHALPPPHTPYLGPLCLHEPGLSQRQRTLDEFRIGELVAAELASRYRSVHLPLSWQFADVRPFLWHNYHAEGAPRYTATPRYTAVLPLTGLKLDNYLPRLRTLRRREWRKAASLALHDAVPMADFLRLYRLTFERQDIALTPAKLDAVRRITEAALQGGWGRLTGCSTPAGLASATLFLHDHARAYYLFGANDPAQRDSGAATRLMIENVLQAAAAGLSELDFVGANSPARGDFKLSFDAVLKPYFELSHVAG